MMSLAGDHIDGSTRPLFSNESKEAWTVSAAKSHGCKSDCNDNYCILDVDAAWYFC